MRESILLDATVSVILYFKQTDRHSYFDITTVQAKHYITSINNNAELCMSTKIHSCHMRKTLSDVKSSSQAATF